MISKKMESALNEQINKELYSAYIYLSMATYLAEQRYDGMASFMKVQAQEEVAHAMKIYGYVEEQGGRVLLDAIKKPESDFKSVKTVFQTALDHEKYITKSIHELVDLAIGEKDHATKTFLDWFVTEQVEEEANMDQIVGKLEMIGGQGHGLFMLDGHLGQRKAH
ncbi:ferritin [candidate division KSB1 bacterium]|nr:ferritin [candidate division KSB1 bacterium]